MKKELNDLEYLLDCRLQESRELGELQYSCKNKVAKELQRVAKTCKKVNSDKNVIKKLLKAN